jgi:hypothetical protein
MKLGKLLVLFLIPVALFFVSCENEIPEEFLFELDPASSDLRTLDDIEFVLLTLRKVPDEEIDDSQLVQPEGGIYIVEEQHPIFSNKRLDKGELLILEDLEPGKYRLTGTAYEVNALNGESNSIGNITGKADKMDEHGNIIIDDFSPTIVKLVYTCTLT